MKLYELINPSDPYTFHAPSIEVAGACAVMLSSGYGAREVGGDGEQTPILFGWDEWLDARGINIDWASAHAREIAEAYDSFLIGDAAQRADVESMLAMLPEEKRRAWRDQRQDRQRSSMSRIGEAAYAKAKAFFAYADKQDSEEVLT